MKFALIFVIVATCATLTLCEMGKIPQLMQQCMAETNLTEADVKEFLSSGMQADAKENMKCYSKCLMEKKGHLKDGVFNPQATIEDLKKIPQLKDSQDEVIAGVEACKNVKGINDCDTAFKITMCLKDNKAIPMRH